jgi:hypothetical protein
LGWLEVVGEVENRGTAPSTYTRVAGTFCDADGKVIYVHFTYTDPSEISPGAKHPFKITVGSEDRTGRIARYSLTEHKLQTSRDICLSPAGDRGTGQLIDARRTET